MHKRSPFPTRGIQKAAKHAVSLYRSQQNTRGIQKGAKQNKYIPHEAPMATLHKELRDVNPRELSDKRGITTTFNFVLCETMASSSRSTYSSHSGSKRWKVTCSLTFLSKLKFLRNSLFRNSRSLSLFSSRIVSILFLSRYDSNTCLAIFERPTHVAYFMCARIERMFSDEL